MILATTLKLASNQRTTINKINSRFFFSGTRHVVSMVICMLTGGLAINVSAQKFTTNQTVVIKGSTGLYTSCASPGTKSITVAVSGIGTLNTSSNQLREIEVTLRSGTDKYNLTNVTAFLKSPSGTCVQIASAMGGSNIVATNRTFKYRFRNVDNTCLNNRQPDYVTGVSIDENPAADHSGMFGIFSTIGDISTSFNGENANGNWTLYFGRNNTSSFFPDAESVSLTFGEPMPATTPSQSGSSCADAVQWSGIPICLSTVGKVNTANRPTTAGCSWLATSENNLWIAFQPVNTNACINISGIKKTGGAGAEGLQSIVVTDNNTDGDNNPCTPTGSGAHWTVVSCPRTNNPAIYSSDVGATRSHNHCFTANTSKTYYLVVDGNANAQTSFYLTGISSLPVILPISLLSFDARETTSNEVRLLWTTASEKNNDYFTLLRSENMVDWNEIGIVKGEGNSSHEISYEFTDRSPIDGISYYKLRQTDFNGIFEDFDPVSVNLNIDESKQSVLVYPNPANDDFEVRINSKGSESAVIRICDLSGKIVVDKEVKFSSKIKISKEELQKGIYVLKVFFEDGSSCSTKLIVE